MKCFVDVDPTGELYEIVFLDGAISINNYEVEILEIPDEAEFERVVIETAEQIKRAYSVHNFELFEDSSYEVVEIIYQVINRMVEGREILDYLTIDLKRRVLVYEDNEEPFPAEDEISYWDARSTLKNLIYS